MTENIDWEEIKDICERDGLSFSSCKYAYNIKGIRDKEGMLNHAFVVAHSYRKEAKRLGIALHNYIRYVLKGKEVPKELSNRHYKLFVKGSPLKELCNNKQYQIVVKLHKQGMPLEEAYLAVIGRDEPLTVFCKRVKVPYNVIRYYVYELKLTKEEAAYKYKKSLLLKKR